jgi:hypothetical protein
MAEPLFTDIFGAGATQTATTIVILKADLAMTAAAINRGEQCFAAICKKAATNLTSTNFSANPDQSVSIAPGFDSLAYRQNGTVQETLLQTQLTINFAKVQPTSGITPDDY